jgi:hypothetical protein
MRNLAIDKRLRHDTDHLASAQQRRIRNGAHQSQARAAVDNADTSLS